MIGVIQQNEMSFNFLNQIPFSVPQTDSASISDNAMLIKLYNRIMRQKNDMNIAIKCKKVFPLDTLSVKITGVTEAGSMNISELQCD